MTLATLLIASAFGVSVRAQSSTPPPASPAATPPASASVVTPTAGTSAASAENQSVTTLEKYTVSDVPITEQVLPTVRPIGDVMGDAQNIIDIPRSVSSVNQAWLQDRMVKNAMDFGQFSPGVYSAAQYGIPGVPFIRGDLAQMYVDGQLAVFSRNSTPMSFNGVEAMDIVKGPGSAVYGPQGEGAGGYVDMVMKQPYFDRLPRRDRRDARLPVRAAMTTPIPRSRWISADPLSENFAYRVSYLDRWGDGYYSTSCTTQTQDLFASFELPS